MANITKEERARREAQAAVDLDARNPRVPVSPVREDADEPITDGATAFPVGTPGTVDPLPAVEEPRPPAVPPMPMFPVRILRGYWPKDGSNKLEPDTVKELPIAEARKLIEDGVAERADALPAI